MTAKIQFFDDNHDDVLIWRLDERVALQKFPFFSKISGDGSAVSEYKSGYFIKISNYQQYNNLINSILYLFVNQYVIFIVEMCL